MIQGSPQHILALFRSGKSTAEIAEHFGWHRTHPRVWRRVELAGHNPERRPDEARVLRFLHLARDAERAQSQHGNGDAA
jgi:transposase-like protein